MACCARSLAASSVAVSQTPGSKPGYRLANSGRSRTWRILLLIWFRVFFRIGQSLRRRVPPKLAGFATTKTKVLVGEEATLYQCVRTDFTPESLGPTHRSLPRRKPVASGYLGI